MLHRWAPVRELPPHTRARRTALQHLHDGRRINCVRSWEDAVLDSAAESLDGPVIAVVLTGTGTNGTNGVHTVNAMEGAVIAHDPHLGAASRNDRCRDRDQGRWTSCCRWMRSRPRSCG